MRKILVITSLFPVYEDQSPMKVSRFLFYFVKEWLKYSDVFVVVPLPFYWTLKDRNVRFGFKEIEGIRIFVAPYFKVPKTNIRNQAFRAIENAIKSINFVPDAIIADINHNFEIAYLLSENFDAKLILGVHQTDIFWLRRTRNIQKCKIYFDHAEKIACRSYAIFRKLKQWFPEYESKMFTAFPGIDQNIIESKKFFESKSSSFEKGNEIVFLTASNLIRLKNIDINLLALSKFKSKRWKYYIIGDGKEKKALVKLTKKLGLENRVIFKGFMKREKVLQEMKRSNVFIMASAPETLGIAYLEAMAKANIVVGAKEWGIDGVVEQGKNGFLVEPRNLRELNKTIEQIFNMNGRQAKNILLNTWETINNYVNERVARYHFDKIFSEDLSTQDGMEVST